MHFHTGIPLPQVETEGVRRSIQNLGVVLTTSAVSHTSVAAGEGLRHAVVGQPVTVTVTTKDKDGELVRTGNAELRVELQGPDGVRVQADVLDNRNGTYEVAYTLRTEGEFSFLLLLYGRPVRGSPFRLRAVKPSDIPASPDDVKRRVKSPSGGGGGHVRQKAVRRPSSMYSTSKKKENPIEDELIYRVGESHCASHSPHASTCLYMSLHASLYLLMLLLPPHTFLCFLMCHMTPHVLLCLLTLYTPPQVSSHLIPPHAPSCLLIRPHRSSFFYSIYHLSELFTD